LAFDLKAVIRIVDNATAPLKRIQRQAQQLQRTTEQVRRSTELWRDANGRLRDSMGRFAAETRKANLNLKQLGNGLRSTGGFVRGLTGQFTALAAAVGGAVAAKKIFDSTIVEAAKFENSQVVIRAMFDDRKAADSYMNMLERFAAVSPVLNSQDMFENSKSFISTSKNLGQLEKMWNLTERLVAIDPLQGVSGAVLALKEFFSGDVVSLVERFELPRAELKAIKDLPLDQKLKELDKFFNKIGATNKLVKEMGGTTLGLWNRIKETVAVVLRNMGMPALDKIRVFLDGVVKALDKSGTNNEFVKFGQDMLAGITEGFISAAKGVGRLAKSIIDNPEFQRLKDVKAKVSFVIENLFSRFNAWLNSGGREQITKMVSTVTGIIAEGLTAATPYLVSISAQVGYAIGKGIVDAAKDYVKNHPVTAILTPQVSDDRDFVMNRARNWLIKKGVEHFFGKPKGKHYHGLSYVPYDGYTASLHRGERILTAKENREYTRGGGGAKSVVITGNTFVVREEADIRKIAGQLADLLAEAGANGA
jgi:hypothetical protein